MDRIQGEADNEAESETDALKGTGETDRERVCVCVQFHSKFVGGLRPEGLI